MSQPNRQGGPSRTLRAEYQQMKHELEILQKKMSNLSMAKMNSVAQWDGSNNYYPASSGDEEKASSTTYCSGYLLGSQVT